MVSALLELPLADSVSGGIADDGWVSVASPRRTPTRSLAQLVAERKARLGAVARNMPSQEREGDLTEMVREHDGFAELRKRANGEILD